MIVRPTFGTVPQAKELFRITGHDDLLYLAVFSPEWQVDSDRKCRLVGPAVAIILYSNS